MAKDKTNRQSAGTLTIGGQTFKVVLEPAQVINAPKPSSAKAKTNQPTAKTQLPFPTTFRGVASELDRVKAASKPRRNKLNKLMLRFRLGKTTLEGSFSHFIVLATLVTLESRGSVDQLDLFAAVSELIKQSGITKKVKFEMKQFKAVADNLVKSGHVTEAGITYTLQHYPHFRTLAIVVG